MGTRYGAPPFPYTKPLTYGLQHRTQGVDFILDLSSQNALNLRSKKLDVALLSPIDYARYSSEYLIVPNLCASSAVGTRTILLHFRKGLRRIKTIAVDIGLTSELVLAKILLKEKYDTDPQFIPMEPDVTAMLAKADAALLVNGSSVFHPFENECSIDLVDEWNDLTDLPYVHALWIGRHDSLSPADLYLLNQSYEEGLAHLEEIVFATADEYHATPEDCESYFSSFAFNLDEDLTHALSEFYRYAFYHGILGEVPEIKFFPTPEGSNISLN